MNRSDSRYLPEGRNHGDGESLGFIRANDGSFQQTAKPIPRWVSNLSRPRVEHSPNLVVGLYFIELA